jgi:transcription initiation factor IIE alpha subunit
MDRKTVTRHFLAALGLERLFERATRDYLSHFYQQILIEYRKEVQVERARLMRMSPMDYRKVRAMDRELDEITTMLREREMAG